MGTTTDIGNVGEQLATEWLMEHGYSLLHKNWRNMHCELDIVATRGENIHFVEVKTRRKASLTSPQDAITASKFRSLTKAAEAYLAIHRIDLEPQFDLISVVYSDTSYEIEYIPEAMICRW